VKVRSSIVAGFAVASAMALLGAGIYFGITHHRNDMKKGKTAGKEWVVLLHGMMRSSRSMNRIQRRLEESGYRVINIDYPSTEESIEDIADSIHDQIETIPPDRVSVHFVTHSMGSIVVRYYLAHYKVKNLGRIVMIAPPNRGSIVAAYLKQWAPYRRIFGRAGQEIARAPRSFPDTLPPPPCEFGVIAGGLGKKIGLNPVIPGDNDGTVGVEETRLPGMADFVLVRGQHSTLLLQKVVFQNVIEFLGKGQFIHAPESLQEKGK
jgi:pimeloyl-ACP methyl ester carboxylesterase